MQQVCRKSGIQFNVSDAEKNIIEKMALNFDGERFVFPLPQISPEERLLERAIQRNEQFLFRNKSVFSGRSLVSIYPDQKFKIVSHEEWWEGDWDPMNYGRDFDFSQEFFKQFQEMNLEIPRVALVQVGNENSPYSTGTGYCKNCYLINCSENCEDCYYSKLLQDCKDVWDSCYAYDSELLYQCFNVRGCYNCVHLSYSQNCNDCFFSENLTGCKNCLLCTNLVGKNYYFMNKEVSKEQYEELVRDCFSSAENVEKAKSIFADLRKNRIHKYANLVNCENCTGDFLMNCQNCEDCYDVNDSQDCKNVIVGVNIKDVVDCNNMYLKPELNYQVLGTIGTYNVAFALYVFNSQNIFYSQFCYDSKDLFGCIGLRNKQYCVFNKQYTKEEYEAKVAAIIRKMQETGEWGSFFPAETTGFPYNQSVAYEYLPLKKEEVLARGLKWMDEQDQDLGKEVPSDVMICKRTGKKYRVLEQEKRFLQKIKMPIPTICPDERHNLRMEMRNPRKLYDRQCAKTGEQVKSTFPPDNPAIIYSEKAYLDEVF